MNTKVATMANAVQYASDVLVEVIGPDVAHEVEGEKITPASLKFLIKAEMARLGVIGDNTNV